MKITTMAMRQSEIEAQMVDLDFDWTSERGADIDKRYAYADTIYQGVKHAVDTTNPLPALFETVRGEAGKKIKAKRHYGGKVYERSYGEYKRVSHFKSKFYTMSTSAKALHIAVSIEELKAGVVTTSELQAEATRAILFHKVSNVWKTLKTALPTSNTALTTNLSSATLIQSALDTAVRDFGDKYQIQGIVGRQKFLWPITNFSGYDGSTGYSEAVKLELYQRGMIGKYKGTDIFSLQDLSDEQYGTSAVDAGNIFIVGAEKGFNRYVEVTPLTSTNEVSRSTNMFHLYFDFEDGYAIWEPKFMYRLWDGTTV